MFEKRCIFCGKTDDELRKENNSWSIEHIIPLSLGNTRLITNDVCANCNNKLGQNVDNYFVNHMLIEMIRKELALKGESGKIPNPFKQGTDQFGRQIRVDDAFNVTLVPQLSTEPTKDGLRFKGNVNSKDEARNMITKSLERKGYNQENINDVLSKLDNATVISYQPNVSYDCSIELNRFALFALKIAYEYACLKLDESYKNDKIAIEIRQMLHKAICGEMKEKCGDCRWVCPTPNDITDSFSIMKESDLKIHMLFLHPDKEGKLICQVFLFLEKLTSFSVIVSENANLYMPLPPIDIIEIHST